MAKVPEAEVELAFTINFCNTYDLLNDPPDRLTVDLLHRIARHHDRATLTAGITDADLSAVRSLRGALYQVFAADTPAGKVVAVNALLDRTSARARLVDAGSPRLTAVGGPSPLDILGATMADAVARAMVDGGPGRLRLCAADPCRCVYVDRTRANRQRYCCELCNDRMASAAYRRRHP